MNPVILRLCSHSAAIAGRVRWELRNIAPNQQWRADDSRRRAAEQIDRIGVQILGSLDRFTPRELDILAGCLGRVEHAIGRETSAMRRFRAAVRTRLGQLGAGIR
jgi:hypothetical protein